MNKVIYLMNVSADGYIEGPDGTFGWSRPDEEVHRFHSRVAQEMGAFLYGRRMYETMIGWQTMDQDPTLPGYILEFARIWRSKPKVVFSTTLRAVGGDNCRLARGGTADEVASIRREAAGDLGVSGPNLASALAALDLIDEYRLVVYPTIVGGGKPFFPGGNKRVTLRLLETRAFSSGAVYLRYDRT